MPDQPPLACRPPGSCPLNGGPGLRARSHSGRTRRSMRWPRPSARTSALSQATVARRRTGLSHGASGCSANGSRRDRPTSLGRAPGPASWPRARSWAWSRPLTSQNPNSRHGYFEPRGLCRPISIYPQRCPISGLVPNSGLARKVLRPVPILPFASTKNGILLVPKTVPNRYI